MKSYNVWIYYLNIYDYVSGEEHYVIEAKSKTGAEVNALTEFWKKHDSKAISFTGSEIEEKNN